MATQLTLNDGSLNSAGALALKTNGTTQAINITTGQQVEFNDGSDSAPSITNTGDTNTGIFFPAADTVGITTGGTERLRLDSSGNLGLGVTPSAWAFPNSKALQIVFAGFAGYGNNAYVTSNQYFTNSGASNYIANGYAGMYIQTSGQHQWFTGASGTAGGTVSWTQAMTLDASGNLGVGTTSPAFGAGSGIEIERSGTATLRLERTSSAAAVVELKADSGAGVLETRDATPLILGTSATERARIDSSGNLLVGTTSATAKIAVLGASTTSANIALYAGNSSGQDLFYVRCDGLINTGSRTLSPYNNTTASAANMYVDSQGSLYRSTSSLKYKKNVQDAVYGLADLLKLRAVTYEGKAESDDGKTFGGLIAEEVNAAGLTEFVQYAEDGTPDALAYGNMVSLCIKAIQEQQALITQLQADVAALKGQA